MKKSIVYLITALSVFSLALTIFVSTKPAQAQTASCPAGYVCTPTPCPVGFICTPTTPQPFGCPAGYICNASPVPAPTPATTPVSQIAISNTGTSKGTLNCDMNMTACVQSASFNFTLTAGNSPIFLSTAVTDTAILANNASIVFAAKGYLVPSKGALLAKGSGIGDTSSYYYMAPGTSRSFVFTGTLSNNSSCPSGFTCSEMAEIAAINYGTSANNLSAYSITQGLENLRVVADFGPTPTNQTPVITGGTFPTSLAVGQTGTWSVSAYDPQNGSLSYSVDWGDQGTVRPQSAPIIQTSTFTHSYASAGTYTITFTVKNGLGLSAQTSTTLQVGSGGGASNCIPGFISTPNGCIPFSPNQIMKVLTPNGGESLVAGQTYRIKWTGGDKTVDVWLLDNPTRLGTEIFSGVTNNGYVDWIVSPLTSLLDNKTGQVKSPSGQYVIFVSCSDNNCIVDDSDAPFKIIGQAPTPTVIPTPACPIGYICTPPGSTTTCPAGYTCTYVIANCPTGYTCYAEKVIVQSYPTPTPTPTPVVIRTQSYSSPTPTPTHSASPTPSVSPSTTPRPPVYSSPTPSASSSVRPSTSPVSDSGQPSFMAAVLNALLGIFGK